MYYNQKSYYIYLTSNKGNTVIYTGVTNNLYRRMSEHKDKNINPQSFAKRYKITKLVYYETFDSIYDAINREKQIKAGSRQKKINLIDSLNPKWNDLSREIGLE
jgi:putative endonuclease